MLVLTKNSQMPVCVFRFYVVFFPLRARVESGAPSRVDPHIVGLPPDAAAG